MSRPRYKELLSDEYKDRDEQLQWIRNAVNGNAKFRNSEPPYSEEEELARKIMQMHARIAELKGVIEILEDQQREVKNILIDKNLHIDSLYEEGYKLQQRIAELEADNAELKERVAMLDVTAVYKSLGEMGYIEQVDKLNARIAELEADNNRLKCSNDTQTDSVVYGKDSD